MWPVVLLCSSISSHSLTSRFLSFLLFFYNPTLRPFNIIPSLLLILLNIVIVPAIVIMLMSILILIFIVILAAVPINLISTISIAEFLELLLPVYNPSSGSLRLLLLLLLPSLPPSLQFSI